MKNERKNIDYVQRQSFLSRRMVRQTEEFLNENLNRADKAWPRKSNPQPEERKLPGYSAADFPENSTMTHGREREHPVRSFSPLVILVEARDGHLDDDRLHGLRDQLHDWLADADGCGVVLNLSRVTSITAAFLNLLKAIHKELARRNRRLALCYLHSQCAQLVGDSGLHELILCCESEQHAIRSLMS